MEEWQQIKLAGLDTIFWWETVVKPGIKKLLIERSQEMNKERIYELNLLLIRQAYLVRKLHNGDHHRIAELNLVSKLIVSWHKKEAEKVKLQFRSEEIDSPENVRI